MLSAVQAACVEHAGYGNVSPVTTVGRVITIIYALFGIPLCLCVLASVGRLLTRAIKFVWAFVRRFYYTGRSLLGTFNTSSVAAPRWSHGAHSPPNRG